MFSTTAPITAAPATTTAMNTVIDLWLVEYRQIDDSQLVQRLEQLLNAEEQQRRARFLHAEDRHRFLFTRATVRTVLSRYAAVEPQDWVFTANAHGRPAIANLHPQAAGLCFNLSHTRGLIVLGVCRDRELGVDVENIRERTPTPGIAERFFAPQESAALASLPEERRHERFFAYWTLKEAYIKARGRGMSIPLDRFCFTFAEESSIHLHIDADQNDNAERWQFWQFRPSDEFLLSVCAERPDALPPSLRFHRLVPTVSEEVLHIAPCAASGNGVYPSPR
jgi:4'-phosphopantetheinyl transferase